MYFESGGEVGGAACSIPVGATSQRPAIGQSRLPKNLDGGFLVDADYDRILVRAQLFPHDDRRVLAQVRRGAHTPAAATLMLNTVLVQHTTTPEMSGNVSLRALGPFKAL